MKNIFSDDLINRITNGQIGIIPTDTIYGLVCSAFNADAVNKIYKVKNRSVLKPVIVLIGQESDLLKFDIKLSQKEKAIISKYWPGPVSILLKCDSEKYDYIHRGTNFIAFRLPKNKDLCEFLKKAGPIVAPSANPEAKNPAKNIKSAKRYFKEKVDFYIDGEEKNGKPSKIFKIIDGEVEQIR